ncbi:MAG: hypothetical protein ACRDPO_25065, partial [Streptosporangiaceae bacterium]
MHGMHGVHGGGMYGGGMYGGGGHGGGGHGGEVRAGCAVQGLKRLEGASRLVVVRRGPELAAEVVAQLGVA